MVEKNYITTDGNNNIILQDINGRNININDIATMKQVFETSEPEYLQKLFKQIDDNYNNFVQKNEMQLQKITALLQQKISERKITVADSKNILTGTISNVGGNVHIGDVIYNVSKPEENIKTDDTNNLKALVSENQVDTVIEKLKLYKINQNSLLMIKAQWEELKMQKIVGVLSNQEINIQMNKIRFSLLQLIETI